MSRVERIDSPAPRRNEQPREARRPATAHDTPRAAHTPTKAEGELDDVEEALRRQRAPAPDRLIRATG